MQHGHTEPHGDSHASQLNWLRAAVLGANDGIVSVSSLVVGVAGATTAESPIIISGIAGLLAGCLSMAVGEYVSVSSQRDTEQALLAKERWELKEFPEKELDELADLYEQKGVSKETARRVAEELTARDAFAAHVETELGINPEELTNPWHAAVASGMSFVSGGVIPLLAIIVLPPPTRIPLTFAAVLAALLITGFLSARVSGAPVLRVMARIAIGGAVAMAITYGIGRLFGIAGV